MDALDYPRIDATVETDGIINLTIQDHNPRTFQDVTTEEALGQVWNHCAHLAQTLGRDVKIYVQEGTKTSYYVLTPEGEPTLQTVTEEVEKTSIWRRKAILIPAAALLALGLGGGALATVNALNHPATTTATTPAGITLTLDNGTYTTASISGDGQRLSYVDGSTLYVTDIKGTLVSQTDLTKNKIEAAGLTIHPTSDGFLYTAPGSYFMWASGKFSSINTITAKAQTIITRAGEPVIISRNDPTPSNVQKISVNGTERYRSPAEGAAFIATSKGSGIWASTRGTGTIITATAKGTETAARPVATPAEGATFTRWVGATATGEVITLWHTPSGQDVLALQSPQNLTASARTIDITGAADSVKIDGTGTIAIAGDQVHHLSAEGSYALPAMPTKVTSRPAGGFTLEFGDGTTGDATPSGYIASTETPVIGTTADGHRVTVSPDHHSIVINP